MQDVCDKLGFTNPGESTLAERLINVEHMFHIKISQIFQDLKSGMSSCKENFQKNPRWRNQYSSKINKKLGIGYIRNFISSKTPHE